MTIEKKKLIWSFWVLGCIFFVLVLSNIHGFSFSQWENYLDSGEDTVLLGTARAIRSDEWVAYLPLILSQSKNNFQKYSSIAGVGKMNMEVTFPVPTKTWIVLFRPSLWGYFVGPDFGLSWMWNFRFFLLLISTLLFAFIVTKKWLVSLLLAVFFSYSSFFQFWSLDREPLVSIVLFLMMLCPLYFRSGTKKQTYGYAILILYLLLTMTFQIAYPPFQILMGLLFAFAVAGWCFDNFKKNSIINKRLKVLIAMGTILLWGGGIAFYFRSNLRELELILNTAYPGERVSAGGGSSIIEIFIHNMSLKKKGDWSFLGNICEASGFFIVFPITVAYFTMQWKTLKNKWLLASLTSFLILCFSWMIFGLPELVSKYLLFDQIPERRTILGLGVVDFLLFVFYISSREQVKIKKKASINDLLIFLIWLALHWSIGIYGSEMIPGNVLWSVLLATIIGYSIIFLNARISTALLAAVSLAGSLWFNPLAIGGSEIIYSSQLGEAIVAIEDSYFKEKKSHSKWITFSNGIVVSNIFKILGVQSVNSLHFYPQNDLWKVLDPEGTFSNVYNRHAHVSFILGDQSEVEFKIFQGDHIGVLIHPDNTKLSDLGVTHLLVSNLIGKFVSANWSKKGTYNKYTVYARAIKE